MLEFSMLTVGIPSRGITKSLVSTIEKVIKISIVDRIVVSINPTDTNFCSLDQLPIDDRIQYHIQKVDLGLYGNFRFLLNSAQSKYFMWLCTDDAPTTNLELVLKSAEDHHLYLAIPNWSWAEYDPLNCTHSVIRKSGWLPDMDNPTSLVDSAVFAEPSWIFGIWNREFLGSIFPVKNFDWLDVHILQCALLSKKVGAVAADTEMIIGTWEWANKRPNSVKPNRHSPYLALLYGVPISLRLILLSPRRFRVILRRFKSLIGQARVLNSAN